MSNASTSAAPRDETDDGSPSGSFRHALRKWACGRWAYAYAGVIGFLEGTVLIAAPEPLLIPPMLSHKRTIWWFAALPALGNVAAGLLLYMLGMWLDEPVIQPLFEWLGATEQYQSTLEDLEQNGFWALMVVGLTPIPFQLGTAAAGAAGYNIFLFMLAVAISRGIRYAALALVVRIIGAHAREWVEKHQLEIFVGGLIVFAIALAVMIVM